MSETTIAGKTYISPAIVTPTAQPVGEEPTVQPVVQPAVATDPMTGQPLTPHKPADDTEQIYFEGSPLVRGILGRGIWWCLLGLVIMAIPVAAYFVRNPRSLLSPWWLNLAFIVIGLLLFFLPMLKAKTIRYRISNYRIDFERGWFSKDIDTLELWHVEDLKFHQSFIDRILGVGSITILSHDDTSPKFILHSLPNPRPIFDALKQRVIAVKRQGGVVKMDTGT
jgi:membrane protein YdbS with pleckstrin-like domain